MIAKFTTILKIITFLSFTPPMMVLQWFCLRFKIGNPHTIPQAYNKALCKILSIRVAVTGQSNQSGLIIANHVSWADILVMNSVAQVSLIAKNEVASWPLVGTLARLQNTIFVNRDKKTTAAHSNSEISKRLVAGDRLVLFAEATTHNGKNILPFKSSFLAAAVETEAPVIPVTIIYQNLHGLPLTLRQRPQIAWYGEADLGPHLWAMLLAGPIHVHVNFHEALNPKSFANRKSLSLHCQNLIKTTLAQNLHQR